MRAVEKTTATRGTILYRHPVSLLIIERSVNNVHYDDVSGALTGDISLFDEDFVGGIVAIPITGHVRSCPAGSANSGDVAVIESAD